MEAALIGAVAGAALGFLWGTRSEAALLRHMAEASKIMASLAMENAHLRDELRKVSEQEPADG